MPQVIRPLWKVTAELAIEAETSGDVVNAERQYNWSLTLAQHSRGPVHEDVGEACINLADFYMSIGRYDESEDFYRRAIDIYERLFGRDNLITAMIYRMLAEISLVEHRDREARIFKARASDILEQRQAS